MLYKISDQVPLVIGHYAKPPQSKRSFPPRGKKIGTAELLLPGEEALEIQEKVMDRVVVQTKAIIREATQVTIKVMGKENN